MSVSHCLSNFKHKAEDTGSKRQGRRVASSTCRDATKPAQRQLLGLATEGVHTRVPNPAPVTDCTGSGIRVLQKIDARSRHVLAICSHLLSPSTPPPFPSYVQPSPA